MNINAPWRRGSGSGADVSTTTAVVAAITDSTLGIKKIMISNLAAANITIEDSTGADLIIFYLPARGGVVVEFDPGEFRLAATGRGINILSSTADAVSYEISAWVE